MRDGVNLMATVFRPAAEGTYPVILVRSPFSLSYHEDKYFAEKGYVYVVQDCRGSGQSEGKLYPGINERNDGKDTHEWILSQPWCNGSIGTTGRSYDAYTQWVTAPDAGDYLKAMFTFVPGINLYDGFYIGGALHHTQVISSVAWLATPPAGHPGIDWAYLRKLNEEKAFMHLPLSTWDDVLGFEVGYLRDWIAHPEYDNYWQQYWMDDSLEDISVPNLTISGWYDLIGNQAFETISRLRKESRSALARKHQYMVVGPWTHLNQGREVGEIDFGREAVLDGPYLRYLKTNWFDHWLKGKDTDVGSWAPLRIFVMGINKWRDEYEWPLRRTRFVPYYFHSNAGAKTVNGDGRLNIDSPGKESEDTFVYDPAHPVPTHGGCNMEFVIPAGAFDQTRIEKRDDVLVYTGQVLAKDLEVTGPVKVILYASSSATDTDWTGKLVDVYPDGRAINICDGIIRARYRDGGAAKLIEPGKVYEYQLDLWNTSNVFLKGHRIRVEISSSNFPRFDRNPNTGHKFGADAEMIKASQKVYHDSVYPSHALLPVIPHPKR